MTMEALDGPRRRAPDRHTVVMEERRSATREMPLERVLTVQTGFTYCDGECVGRFELGTATQRHNERKATPPASHSTTTGVW